MKACLSPLAILLVLSGIASAGDDEQPAMFKITTKRADDTVEVRADNEKTLFAQKSLFGIGQVVI